MWSIISAAVIVVAQVATPGSGSKAGEWCFDREQQGAKLCEATEAECNKLRSINTEIARSPCKRVEPPTEPLTPPNPEKQTPNQR